MNQSLKSIVIRLSLIAALTAPVACCWGQGAIATISAIQAGANYNYTIVLQDTGAGNLNSFWYGWTTGGNNLPSIPSNPLNNLGWGNSVVGNSIEWVNSSGTALTPGQSGIFTFVSASTPAQMTTLPSGNSVAYVNGIDFSQGSSGHSTPVFAPVLSVPEPSSLALLTVGGVLLMALFVRKLGHDRPTGGY